MPKSFVLIDESLLSPGFWVKVKGIDLKQFKRNPVMYFMHIRPGEYENSGKDMLLPIGYWDNIRVEDDQVLADPVYDDKDEFAVKIRDKVDSKVIRMASIGLQPVIWSEEEKDIKPGQPHPTLIKSIAIEASIVDRGMNNNALRLYNEDNSEIKLSDNTLPVIKTINQTQTKMKKILQFFKLNENSGEDAVLPLVEGLSNENDTLKAKITGLEAEVQTFKDRENSTRKDDITTLVDKAIADRKILTGQKDQYVKLLEADFDTTKALLDGMKGVVKLGEGLGDSEDTEHKDWKWDDYHTKDPETLEKMRDADRDNYIRLYEAKFKKKPNLKAIVVALILALFLAIGSQAQTINYPFGYAEEQTVTTDTTVLDFTTSNQVVFVTVADVDTNITVTCTPASEMRTGALLYLQLTADATERTITFGTGLTGAAATHAASKTVIYTFIYRSGYKLQSTQQID